MLKPFLLSDKLINNEINRLSFGDTDLIAV
jgi:hypothetical protein